MREDFFRYMFAVVLDYVVDKENDLEASLKEVGYNMGKMMVILKNFRPESNIEVLLYRLVYNLLPSFHEADWSLEKDDEDGSTYFIVENKPLLNPWASLPVEFKDFSCDSLFAGAIEYILKASRFRSEVDAYNSGTEANPDRVIHKVKIIGRPDQTMKIT